MSLIEKEIGIMEQNERLSIFLVIQMKKGTDKVPPKNSFDLVSAINQG